MEIEQLIDCIDCGGRCHLMRLSVPEDPEPGDVIQYRCEDCNDVWYLVIPDEAMDE
jgi:hypothetical protein